MMKTWSLQIFLGRGLRFVLQEWPFYIFERNYVMIWKKVPLYVKLKVYNNMESIDF